MGNTTRSRSAAAKPSQPPTITTVKVHSVRDW